METPKSGRKLRATRNPTPRLSERKKSLFIDDDSKLAGNDVLDGIKPLDPTNDNKGTNSISTRSRRNIECLLDSKRQPGTISFLNDTTTRKNSPNRTQLRRSPRTNVGNQSPAFVSKIPIGKENTPSADLEEYAEENLQKLFNTSMRITSNKNHAVVPVEPSEALKRHHEKADGNVDLSPHRKAFKFSSNDEVLGTISTKKFYSASRPACLTEIGGGGLKSPPIINNMIHTRNRPRRSPKKNNINKGVKHKIKKPSRTNFSRNNYRNTLSSVDVDLILKNVRNEKLKSLIVSKREQRQNIEKIHNIFRFCKNPIEMARPLTAISRIDDTNNDTSAHNLSTCNKDQSEMTDEADTDFSDIDSNLDEFEELYNVEEVIPIISHEPSVIEAAIMNENESDKQTTTTPTKRKFFKSGRASHTPKEVRITENIKASICNGKLSLIQEEKKLRKKPKRRASTTYDISDEQATVEAILRNLDDTTYGDIDQSYSMNKSACEESNKQILPIEANKISLDDEYVHFRSRLPYNTNDPAVVEQQHLLLDFLINNNMCTEENFTIFIADPDNHKDEAARIVDQVFVLVNEQDYFRQRIPFNTTDPEIEAQQRRMLDFLIENNICTEDNFDIFIANYNQRYKEADEIIKTIKNQGKEVILQINEMDVSDYSDIREIIEKTIDHTHQSVEKNAMAVLPLEDNSKIKFFPIFDTIKWKPLEQKSKRNIPRTWNFGLGNNQYQIDVGQKNFGAYQCKQCGLVYSVHEPEEEQLHRDYHASLHLLRFKGWIDEDIVAIYPEWGADGRILRITESSHNRRHERLADILKIVDRELGFASYVIPSTFVAYLAVRKYQIVGLCLVVPLEKANKYIKVDGIDCCTQEEYPAKCGISRIWVSPLHRRLHIATKLINAVQQNTIFGEEITLDMIAFSAPTEHGRMFAQKVTKLENFLVYQ